MQKKICTTKWLILSPLLCFLYIKYLRAEPLDSSVTKLYTLEYQYFFEPDSVKKAEYLHQIASTLVACKKYERALVVLSDIENKFKKFILDKSKFLLLKATILYVNGQYNSVETLLNLEDSDSIYFQDFTILKILNANALYNHAYASQMIEDSSFAVKFSKELQTNLMDKYRKNTPRYLNPLKSRRLTKYLIAYPYLYTKQYDKAILSSCIQLMGIGAGVFLIAVPQLYIGGILIGLSLFNPFRIGEITNAGTIVADYNHRLNVKFNAQIANIIKEMHQF